MPTHEIRNPRPAGTEARANTKNSNANFNRIVDAAIRTGKAGVVCESTNNPIELLLDRLDVVRQVRPDRWTARCPAHDDRSPSLAVTEGDDGKVLIKCWAGCSPDAIVSSLGLELRDLFPRSIEYRTSNRPKAPRYSASEVLKTAITESTILELGFRALASGQPLSLQDQGRVWLAIDTLNNLREVVR